ncbi:unnamed protein product [Dicrocoelium dendriticum]|nr:unnamed protein product [Dicrocoelium dendriticum]
MSLSLLLPHENADHPTPSYPNPFNDYAIRRVPSGGSAWAGEAPILPAPSVPTYFDGFLASDPLCSPQPPIPLGLSHRGCISRRLQEERARFAILQAQFSKQLRDTWACLRVTRSAGRLKPNEPYSPLFHSSATTNELRLDPAGASDGASTGGCGGVPGPTGLAAVGVDGPSPTHVGGLHESTHPAMQHPVQLEHTGWDHPECAVGRVPANAPFGVQNPYYEPTDLSTGRFCPSAAAFTGAQVPG